MAFVLVLCGLVGIENDLNNLISQNQDGVNIEPSLLVTSIPPQPYAYVWNEYLW